MNTNDPTHRADDSGVDHELLAGGDETTPTPEPAPTRPAARSRFSHAARLLMAPLLATLAVGAHWVLNVPHTGVKVSDKDQGAPKPDPKKKGSTKPKKKGGFEPRPIGEVEAAFERYKDVDFEAEPVKSAWARPHQSLVNKAVTLARKTAFDGAPDEPRVSVTGVECRTVRCRFVLRSNFATEVDILSETLSRLESEGQTIWRGYTATRIEAPTPDSPKSDTYLQVTVAFQQDSMDSASFAVPEDAIAGGAASDTDENARTPDDDDDKDSGDNQPE